MTKTRWILVGVLAIVLGVGLGIYFRASGDESPLDAIKQKLAATPPAPLSPQINPAQVTRLENQLRQTQTNLDQARMDLAKCQGDIAQCQNARQALAAQARPQWQGDDTLYFRPGSTKLGRSDRRLVKKVVGQIKALGDPHVRIEGHADKVPMSPATKARYGDNLGLSVVRSLEVARELFKQGVPVERVIVVGYGTTKPLPPQPGKNLNNRRAVIRHMPQPPR